MQFLGTAVINASSGAELWRVNVGVPIFNAPVANGGRVFVSAQDNHFHAFAESTGRELWRVPRPPGRAAPTLPYLPCRFGRAAPGSRSRAVYHARSFREPDPWTCCCTSST